MWTTILYILLAWFLYNFIFKFLIPVFRAGRKMKQEFRRMQETMQEQMNRQQGGYQTSSSQASPGSSRPKQAGDYIDFEEIK